MKTTYVSAILGLASSVCAHYTFDKLTVGGTEEGAPNEYIASTTTATCPPSSRASPTAPSPTTTRTLPATRTLLPRPRSSRSRPVTRLVSSRLSAVLEWNTLALSRFQYLIRGEHIALHGAHGGEAEFYYACAQMEVTGNSASSIPGTSVKIPGVYKQDDPAVNFSLWGSSTAYDVTPGPDVIPGGTIRGSADGASGDVVKTVEVGASSDSAPAAEAANNQPQAQPEYSQGNPAGNNDGGCNSTYVRRHARDIVRA